MSLFLRLAAGWIYLITHSKALVGADPTPTITTCKSASVRASGCELYAGVCSSSLSVDKGRHTGRASCRPGDEWNNQCDEQEGKVIHLAGSARDAQWDSMYYLFQRFDAINTVGRRGTCNCQPLNRWVGTCGIMIHVCVGFRTQADMKARKPYFRVWGENISTGRKRYSVYDSQELVSSAALNWVSELVQPDELTCFKDTSRKISYYEYELTPFLTWFVLKEVAKFDFSELEERVVDSEESSDDDVSQESQDEDNTWVKYAYIIAIAVSVVGIMAICICWICRRCRKRNAAGNEVKQNLNPLQHALDGHWIKDVSQDADGGHLSNQDSDGFYASQPSDDGLRDARVSYV